MYLSELWEYSRRHGLSRRRFVRLLLAGGSIAVLDACEIGEAPRQASGTTSDTSDEATGGTSSPPGGESPWVKDPAPFILHPTNLETPLSSLEGLFTPNELFFVRNHATTTPILDPVSFRLRIEGDAIPRPLELSLAELKEMPSRSVVAYLECAGNWRSFFGSVLGRTARGGPWGTGGVGCATWTGVPLGEVLARAGVSADAVDVLLTGADDVEFNRPMPIAKALDPDTIVAYKMNGVDLPPDHGSPLRGLVPGWVASNSVKWLTRIDVSTETQWVRNNTSSYVLIGDEWPAERYAPAEGGPVTTQTIKSTLALDWPAEVTAGRQVLKGFAYSPHAD
ncbi:MAG TPA: oxidoreductase, partial [Gemmatimonadetes bacterium]|nr:oxidoreductase [Gemmatimonadota bacterium]